MPVWASPLTQDEAGQAPPEVLWPVRSKECPLDVTSAGVPGPSCSKAWAGTARAELPAPLLWPVDCKPSVAKRIFCETPRF